MRHKTKRHEAHYRREEAKGKAPASAYAERSGETPPKLKAKAGQ
jgi:hypothetical protein